MYQYGTGCLSDGVLGFWMARVCGMGETVSPDKVKSAEIPGKYRERLGETKLVKIKDGLGNLFALLKKRLSS